MNFDSASVEPFLLAVAARIDKGFDEAAARELAARIVALPISEDLTQWYGVEVDGQHMTIRVNAHMDDVEAPDVAIYAPAPLARLIDEEIRRFLQRRGATPRP